ncbi:hypothetical protein [Klebsiella sp. BIGb0407]|uniref:hypothetical protein n=1 Tax=Klebsiella sp. BIGb0407 TaxID=2940603 RepID=UPI002166D8D6|nr:hypothetical protein [Klebsiella sp. BIGb0407]MCS3431873.1 hypothetical protein [Klebsiella sp. BIGb0407]
MFENIHYDFSAGKQLSDYSLEKSTDFPFQSTYFEGNILKLVASDSQDGELVIKTKAKVAGISLLLSVKNVKGTASNNGHPLINNSAIKISTVANGDAIISVKHGDTFEFTGYELAAG